MWESEPKENRNFVFVLLEGLTKTQSYLRKRAMDEKIVRLAGMNE